MAHYAIGDVQGCYDPLRRLLDKLNFDPSQDQLWFAGDMINRGPQSLEVLRFIKALGDSARCVLGNHECHFLAVAYGHKKPHKADTFKQIIEAEDADSLIQWLRFQPFFYQDRKLGYSMLHAGVPAQWSLTDTQAYAKELEAVIQGDQLQSFLAVMYGNQPDLWNDELGGDDRLRFIINSFTRMRFCDKEGRSDLSFSGAVGEQEEHLMPWFKVPKRRTANDKILFGHWSTLGLHQENNTICLDSGCLWGGELSAIKLGTNEEFIKQDCRCALQPF
ncbi:bis(5'-nucleosyl)-tetraphosphatase (symmetrical) [Cycloclasticus sp. 46_120_T64]|nr:bis(5'-nucleosyl)-tetraphosphatase (symmetrical) [Cycloclasticus sp. 46_120_T64]